MEILADASDRAQRKIETMSSGSAESFGSGYINGLASVLEDVLGSCQSKCSEIGREFAEITAGVFCSISRKIGRTARFEGMKNDIHIACGNPYNTSCESSFISTARQSCSSYANGDAFRSYYRASENGCCSYDPN
jgi:hypothetical protein